MSAASVAPRGAILRSTAPQRSKRRGARTRPPSLDARGFASWPVVRHDQVMWITFGDIAAVVVGSLVAGAWGPTCAALTAGVGACAVALAWLHDADLRRAVREDFEAGGGAVDVEHFWDA